MDGWMDAYRTGIKQNIEAHSASFANFKDHLLITFASKTLKNGQLVAKLHIIELGQKPGQPGFAKRKPISSLLQTLRTTFLLAYRYDSKE